MEHIRWALDRMHTLASGSLPDGDVLAALQLYSLQDKLLQQVEFDDAVDEFVVRRNKQADFTIRQSFFVEEQLSADCRLSCVVVSVWLN